jgi:hypothetical protein
MVETILARGDYRVGDLLVQAFNKGQIFSAWDKDFDHKLWQELIDGTEYEDFLTEFNPEEPLPWDFLYINFSREYLQKEYINALKGLPTPSCDQMECATCRGCDYKMKRVHPQPLPQDQRPNLTPPTSDAPSISFAKVRLFYRKTGDFTFLSHLSMMKYLERLIRRTGIPFECTQGFTPRIKLSCLPALLVFATGLEEVGELFMDDSFSEADIISRLKEVAQPEGFTFTRALKWPGPRSLSKDIHLLHFTIELDDPDSHLPTIHQLLSDHDSIRIEGNQLHLSIDFSRQGQERFAKIYKSIDPEKKRTMYLTRTGVTFKEQLSP